MHLSIPDVLNVPPALVDVVKVETSLPQLHDAPHQPHDRVVNFRPEAFKCHLPCVFVIVMLGSIVFV